MNSPRQHKNATSPGAYLLASQVFSNVFDPNDKIQFNQFITGYGEISSAKLQCYVSGDIVDGKKSIMTHGLKRGEDGRFYWGRENTVVPSGEFSIVFGGIQHDEWPESSAFFDLPDDHRIATESSIAGTPPINYSFQLRKNIKPGDYKIDFFFTYFNGEKWVCIKEPVPFKVRTIFEKYSVHFATFGVVCTITGLGLAIARMLI